MYYNTEARLPYVKPEDMNERQKEFHEIHVKAFQTMPYYWITEEGELNGPSNILCHEIELGFEFLPFNRDIIKTNVARNGWDAHETAILVTVTAAKAQYGMYAHTMLAKKNGNLTDEQIAAIMCGRKPDGLSEKASAAFDLATALNGVGPIPGSVYDCAIKVLGQEGVNSMVFAVGMFKMVGTFLNAFNEPVPEYRR